jgi:anaerobic selenocysteine-containing dehydrogenase
VPREPVLATGLTLVPVRRLYDAGTLASASLVLQPLVPAPYVAMSPFDAGPLGLVDGQRVTVSGARGSVTCDLVVQEGLTPGVVLLPESLRWPLPPRQLLDGRPTAPVTVAPAPSDPGTSDLA